MDDCPHEEVRVTEDDGFACHWICRACGEHGFYLLDDTPEEV